MRGSAVSRILPKFVLPMSPMGVAEPGAPGPEMSGRMLDEQPPKGHRRVLTEDMVNRSYRRHGEHISQGKAKRNPRLAKPRGQP